MSWISSPFQDISDIQLTIKFFHPDSLLLEEDICDAIQKTSPMSFLSQSNHPIEGSESVKDTSEYAVRSQPRVDHRSFLQSSSPSEGLNEEPSPENPYYAPGFFQNWDGLHVAGHDGGLHDHGFSLLSHPTTIKSEPNIDYDIQAPLPKTCPSYSSFSQHHHHLGIAPAENNSYLLRAPTDNGWYPETILIGDSSPSLASSQDIQCLDVPLLLASQAHSPSNSLPSSPSNFSSPGFGDIPFTPDSSSSSASPAVPSLDSFERLSERPREPSPSASESGSGKPRRFPCIISGCSRRFTSQYTLKVHVDAHKPKARVSFACTHGCAENFSRQHDRLRHEVSKHGKVCEWLCHDCGRFFSSKATLGHHKCPAAKDGMRWVS